MKLFENKVALVTGAASGIGKATAKAFLDEGAKVILADYVEVPVENASSIFKKCDISDEMDVASLISFGIKTFGKIDVAVHCAGIAGTISQKTHLYPKDQFEKQIQVNLMGTWYMLKHVITQFLAQGGGNIVCISSAAGLVGQAENIPYAASKHAINGMVKTAAIEYATENIRVNAICPTAIETPMIMQGRRKLAENPIALEQAINFQRMKRMGKPREIADIALWLCSDQSSFVTGLCMPADGGALA